ncbi:MAG TPA: serine protease [Desulfatiglandales bacterium]|nr:serine protease [Desulfatiglandales bacterium]
MRNKNFCTVFLLVALTGACFINAHASGLTPKEVYQKVSPGVVFIFASEGSGKGSGGTGSIIRGDGLVITNAHVFTRKDSSELISDIWVFLKPEKLTGNSKTDLSRRYKGEVVAYDIPLDLALVKIQSADMPLNGVLFGDSDKIVIGDQAYAIGHPEQGGLWSLTTGVISAQKSNYANISGKDLFQTEASINRGNSGGPLLNEQGIMIGINSLIARQAEDGLAITAVNFAIKSNVALTWLNKLGYRFAAVEAPRHETRQEQVKEETEKIEKTAEPKEPVKEKQVIEKPVESEDKGQVSEPESLKKEQKERILTEKRPFNMDQLIADMQDMEDLMEEMRGTIEEFRKRR